MTSNELATTIQEYIFGVSANELDKIHSLVGKDKAATLLNLSIALTWSSHIRLTKIFKKETAHEITNCIISSSIPILLKHYKLTTEELRILFKNRFYGYKKAIESNEGEPTINVANYFMGCCTDLRLEIPYEHVIPDPNDLESIEEWVNKDALEDLLLYKNKHNCVTYPLNSESSFQISACIFGFGNQLDSIIKNIV